MKKLFFLLLLFGLCFCSNIDFSINQSICQPSSDIFESIENFPSCMFEQFLTLLTNGLIETTKTFADAGFALILANPKAEWFCAPFQIVMGIIESLYIILLLGVGLFYIARATNVEGRITAKKWLKNIFFMMLLLSFSFPIFKIILELNHSLSETILEQANLNFLNAEGSFTDFIVALSVLFVFSFMAILSFFTLLIRYIFLPFLLLLFPISIFLYFIPITGDFGKFLLKTIFLVVFMTTVDSLLILGFSFLFNTADPIFANPFIRSMSVVSSLASIALVNVSIFLICILMAISQGFKLAGEIISHATRLAILASVL